MRFLAGSGYESSRARTRPSNAVAAKAGREECSESAWPQATVRRALGGNFDKEWAGCSGELATIRLGRGESPALFRAGLGSRRGLRGENPACHMTNVSRDQWA